MPIITFVGDLILNSSCYTNISLDRLLKEKFNISFVRIDSILDIIPSLHIENPVKYDDEIKVEKSDMIVLSIFSNDVRNYHYNDEYINEIYFKSYEGMIARLKKKCKKLVIVYPHKPYLGEGSHETYFTEEIETCHNIYYKFIISMAGKYKLSILNLNKSFDCNDFSNYLYLCDLCLTEKCNIKIASAIINIYKDLNENSIYSI